MIQTKASQYLGCFFIINSLQLSDYLLTCIHNKTLTHKTYNIMTLTQEIKNNSYLKLRNLTDEADCTYALSEVDRLEAKHGESITLTRLYNCIFNKRNKFRKKI